MENKYIIVSKPMKRFSKKGLCSFHSLNKKNFETKLCLECENTQSASDADYIRYLNEIDEIRTLFFKSNWKEVPRKRLRSTRNSIDLDFVDSTDLIRSQQRKVSEELFEEGELLL